MANNNQPIQNTIDQGRASHAYTCVYNFVQTHSNKDTRSEYKSYSKKLPMMIKNSGLGAAMAFTLSKSKEHHKAVLDDIISWLCQSMITKDFFINLKKLSDKYDQADFVKKIINFNSNEYRVITNEVIAYMTWHRRFTEGLITK